MPLSPMEEAQAKAIAQFVVDEIARAITPLRERIAQLEQRGVEYCGVYQRAVGYRRGAIVTFDNHMHVAVTDVEPNQAPLQSSAWQLCLKGAHDRRAPTQPRTDGFHPVEHRTNGVR
jgi:hypothetical protein